LSHYFIDQVTHVTSAEFAIAMCTAGSSSRIRHGNLHDFAIIYNFTAQEMIRVLNVFSTHLILS